MNGDSDNDSTAESSGNERHRLSTKLRIVFALGVLVIVAALLGFVNELIKTKETKLLSFSGVSVVNVNVESGSIDLRAGTSSAVEITRDVVYSLRGPSLTEKVEDGILTIHAACSDINIGECSARYTISLPSNVEVNAKTGSGAVNAAGVVGKTAIQTSGGKVTLNKTYGDVAFDTDNGSVTGTAVSSLKMNGHSKSGKVALTFAVSPTAVDVQSVDGDITLQVPNTDTSYNTDISSANSKTTVDIKRDANSPRSIIAKSENGKVTVERS